MAMMAKMRSLAPAFILSVGVLFVLFMVISDSSVMQALGGRSNVIGEINGEEISYQEFSKAIDRERTAQKNQTGKDIPEENMDQFRNQVWDAMVTQKLLEQEINKLGITVSNQEIRNVILGDNPPEFLKRNFIDSTGKFNRQAYESAIYNPQNKEALIQAEDAIRQTKLNQKLQSEILASVTVSEQELRRKFIDQNIKLNVNYALFGISEYPDSIFNVSEKELKNYYDEHLDQYKIPAQRKIKYVMFDNKPSAEDSDIVRRNMENVLDDLKTDTSSFKSYISIYSSVPYSEDTLSLGNVEEPLGNALYTSSEGKVVGPVITSQGYGLYHVLKIFPSNETFVRARHILINQYGNDQKNEEEAMKLYQELKSGKIKFDQAAEQYSKDPGSAKRGGDLGWFGRKRMVPEFEKAAFSGRVGEIQKPIKSNFGYHIIEVTGKTNNKYVVEKILEPVNESAATKDSRYNAAGDFAYLAQKNDFDNEAKLMNYTVKETGPFMENATTVPGVGTSKRLIEWVFDNSLNTVSDVYKVPAGYVVAKISDIKEASIRPFDEVKKYIKPYITREKKFERAKEEAESVKSKINGDLNKVTNYDPKAIVKETGSFSAGATTIPGIGRDYAFLENSLRLNVNQLSDPVKGEKGYYLLKLLSKTPFDSSAYAAQRSALLNQILQQKKNTFLNEWISDLKKNADIVDNRYKFYTQ